MTDHAPLTDGEVLHGDFVLRDGSHTDIYVVDPITDEKLDEWETTVAPHNFFARRLIAELRASRAEVRALRQTLTDFNLLAIHDRHKDRP